MAVLGFAPEGDGADLAAAGARLPGGPMCPMKRVNIKNGWY